MNLCRDPGWRYFPTVSIPATSDESFVILHLSCAIRQVETTPTHESAKVTQHEQILAGEFTPPHSRSRDQQTCQLNA